MSQATLKLNDNFAKVTATEQVSVSFWGFGQGKYVIDHRFDLVQCDHAIHRLKHFPTADVNTLHINAFHQHLGMIYVPSTA
jgi:hypothetical protein